MLKANESLFRIFFQVSDATVVFACWILAYIIRFNIETRVWSVPSYSHIDQYFQFGLVLVVVWYFSLESSGAYRNWRMPSKGAEFFTVFKASLLGFLIFVALTHFIARESISRVTMGLFLLFVVVGLNASRMFIRRTLRVLRKRGFNQRRVLIVGHTKVANVLTKRILDRPELGLSIIGLVPVGPLHATQLKIFPDLHRLKEVITGESTDHIIVALKNEDFPKLDKILSEVVECNVDVKVIPDISQYSILGFDVDEFEGFAVLNLNQSPVLGWNAVMKRLSDIVYAGTALTFFSPIMLIIAVLIKLTSKGPIFFSQERMGLDGLVFKMFKFRSMRLDAEAKTGAIWAQAGDDRTTLIGRVIRKTSLDELPQLFNVLRGDMSCVGPRPERPIFVEQFKKEIPGYMLRHKVKSGMTGWAQVNGLRGNTSLEDRIEYDLYYITKWSIWFDLKIMAMTVFKGFISPHAY